MIYFSGDFAKFRKTTMVSVCPSKRISSAHTVQMTMVSVRRDASVLLTPYRWLWCLSVRRDATVPLTPYRFSRNLV